MPNVFLGASVVVSLGSRLPWVHLPRVCHSWGPQFSAGLSGNLFWSISLPVQWLRSVKCQGRGVCEYCPQTHCASSPPCRTFQGPCSQYHPLSRDYSSSERHELENSTRNNGTNTWQSVYHRKEKFKCSMVATFSYLLLSSKSPIGLLHKLPYHTVSSFLYLTWGSSIYNSVYH